MTTIRGSFLKVRLFGRESDLSVARAAGIALAIIGVALLVLMFSAQSRIDEIGETTDPDLLIELDDLRDARDAYMVSAVGFAFLGMFGVVRPLGEERAREALGVTDARLRQYGA